MMLKNQKFKKAEFLHQHYRFMLPISNATPQIHEFMYTIIDITGGGTLHGKSRGLWLHKNVVYDEPVRIFEVFSNITDKQASAIIEAFLKFGRDTNQHSIAFETNGVMIIMEVEH